MWRLLLSELNWWHRKSGCGLYGGIMYCVHWCYTGIWYCPKCILTKYGPSACSYLELIISSLAREYMILGMCVLQIPTWYKPFWWEMAPHTFIVEITHPTSQGSTHDLWLCHRCTRWLQIRTALSPYSQQKLVQRSVHESLSARLFHLLCNVSSRKHSYLRLDIIIHT
jgi:ribosomal protein L37AE/L43A